MTDIILYARYSTTMQSAASVEDQFRLLRSHAERQGWTVSSEYCDRAVSGTIRDRPGLAGALQEIDNGCGNILLIESLDRLSRDQEDLAGLYKRISFAGARIVTVSEGDIGTLHIGMGGTMSALFLEQLGEKVRRGHVGRVKAGRIPGGLSYGYRKKREFTEDGELEHGLREIDPDQAEIVRRIFTEYASGKSGLAIAKDLNAEGIRAPRGGLWQSSAITGNRKRGNGIIHNQLYIGRIVYNRQTFRKDPETRKRVARTNSENDITTQDVPELRIIDQDLWDRAQAVIRDLAAKPATQRRRKKHLFSGMLRCSECGGKVIIVAPLRWGCGIAKQTGSCTNLRTIRDEPLQQRVWSSIQQHLLHPDVIAAYLDEFRIAWAEERRRRIADHADVDRRLRAIKAQERRIADAIVAGVDPVSLVARSRDLTTERERVVADSAQLPDLDHTVAHPTIIAGYRDQVARLAEIAATDREAIEHARPLLQSMIDHIEISPRADATRGVDLTLHGELAQLLSLGSPERKKPADHEQANGQSMLSVVAGVGFGRKHSFAIAA